MLPAKKLSKYQLPIGTNTATGNPLALDAEWLRTGLHLIGPTGCGKSMVLFSLFQQLAKIRNATIFLFDPKGSLYRMARDWSILHGLTEQLVLFDLSEDQAVIGYNPLLPNGQPIPTQVKFARETFRSAWAQSTFDQTPQLARILFMILFVARTLELGLLEAVNLLRPGSGARKLALAKLPPSYVREALEYFDSLPERRQEELSASTLARLEPFVADLQIARTIQPKSSLNLAEVIRQHKRVLINIEHYRPLLPDDSRLIGRMLINDVVAHTFERGEDDRDPVFLIIDEVQEVATRDLCAALDRGRGLNLHLILAHQHCAQLMEEDKTGYLFHSVMNDARTKIIFGGSSTRDLEQFMVKEVLIDQYDPWIVKDELMSLECEPVEETRMSTTKAHSHSHGQAVARPESVSESESETAMQGITASTAEGENENVSQAATKGKTKGSSLERSMSEMQAEQWAETDTTAQHWADTTGTVETDSEGTSQASASGASGSSGYDYTFDADGNLTRSYSRGSGWNTQGISSTSSSRSASTIASYTDGGSMGHASMRGGTTARTVGASVGENESESESETIGKAAGKSKERSLGVSLTNGKTTGKIVTRGVTPSESEEWGESSSETTSPFHAYHKRRVVTNRTYLTEQEFLTLGLQKIKAQPTGHFLIKVPTRPAVFARAPFIKEPRITERQLAAARERIFAQPYYTRIEATPVESRQALDLPYQGEPNHADRDIHRDTRKPRRPKTPPAS